jgi:hypothetical protein
MIIEEIQERPDPKQSPPGQEEVTQVILCLLKQQLRELYSISELEGILEGFYQPKQVQQALGYLVNAGKIKFKNQKCVLDTRLADAAEDLFVALKELLSCIGDGDGSLDRLDRAV